MAQSLLATDGYKFSMAEAGWPLRTETFYYSHRKGGPQVLPVDVPAFVRSLLPRRADDDYRYLAEHSYEMGPGFKAAIVQTERACSNPGTHTLAYWTAYQSSKESMARWTPSVVHVRAPR